MTNRQLNKLVRLFSTQGALLCAPIGTGDGIARNAALAKLTPSERIDMEIVCLSLAGLIQPTRRRAA